MKQETVKLKHLHIAPRKVRLLADAIKGLRANEAEAQLFMRNQRSAQPLLKLLRSAVANAVNNKKMDADRLVISKIWVDQGPMLKRMLPRAQGRGTPIHKKSSHITLVLQEIDKKSAQRFVLAVTDPKEKKAVKPKKESPKPEVNAKDEAKPKEQAGIMKKIFRRKAV